MMNMSIECDVKSCKYHHQLEAYCSKNAIKVVKDKQSQQKESACASFEKE